MFAPSYSKKLRSSRNQPKEYSFMNNRQFNQPSQIGNPSIIRNKFVSYFLMTLALLAAASMPGNTARAGNILVNPGFEADGNHGSGVQPAGWSGLPGGPWYINSD